MQPASPARSASCRCALLLVLVLPAVVRAEYAASPASDHTHYCEEIQVTGHYENAVGSSDAASAGRITRQLVEDRPILRPGEVLELVPGLIITQHSGAGKANQYFLRGFNLDHGTDFLTTLDGMPVNLRTHAHGQGYTDLIPLRAVETGQIDRFGAIDPTTGGKSHRFSLSGDYQQGLGAGLLQANVYAVKYRLNLFSNFTYFLDDPVNGDQIEQADNRWIFGTSGRYAWNASADSISLHATVGWEARHDRIDTIGLYDTAAQQRLGTVRQDAVRETSGSLFAEAELTPTRWLRFLAGLRYDHYFFDVQSDNPLNSGNDDAGRLSPKLSAILSPWAKTEFFANFGFGFHSNDSRGVITTVDPKSGEPVSKVTPLVPTRGGELGVRTEIIPDTQSALALWRLDIASELLFTGDAGTTEPSRASRRYGIEWNTQWHPVRWLVWDLVLAWSHARFTSPDPNPAVTGDRIPGSIEWAASAGVTLHELGPWRASLYMRYFGPRPLIEDDSERSTASTVFNAQTSFKLTGWARLTLDVFNLFDAQVDDIAYFYTSRLRNDPAAGSPAPVLLRPRADIHFHPAEKRSLRLVAAFTF